MKKQINMINRVLTGGAQLFTILMVFGLMGCSSDSDVDPPTPNPDPGGFYDWDRQIVLTTVDLRDIDFVDNSFGWVTGNELLLATAIGGSNWSEAPQELGNPLEQVESIHFINQQLGWLVGNNEAGEGQIFQTQQSGAYFALQEISQNPLYGLFFFDNQKGWTTGANGEIIHTTDGGAEWNTIATLGVDSYDIHFTTDKKGWVVGANGSLFNTTDGTNFVKLDLGTQENLNAVHFTDTLYGYVCGDRNTIFKRSLNAQNQIEWTDVSIPEASEASEWRDICFLDRLRGWVVGNEGTIYKTTDAGVTWERERADTFENLNAVSMISNTTGWIAGDNGLILTYNP